jgi:hypothetical protein
MKLTLKSGNEFRLCRTDKGKITELYIDNGSCDKEGNKMIFVLQPKQVKNLYSILKRHYKN